MKLTPEELTSYYTFLSELLNHPYWNDKGVYGFGLWRGVPKGIDKLRTCLRRAYEQKDVPEAQKTEKTIQFIQSNLDYKVTGITDLLNEKIVPIPKRNENTQALYNTLLLHSSRSYIESMEALQILIKKINKKIVNEQQRIIMQSQPFQNLLTTMDEDYVKDRNSFSGISPSIDSDPPRAQSFSDRYNTPSNISPEGKEVDEQKTPAINSTDNDDDGANPGNVTRNTFSEPSSSPIDSYNSKAHSFSGIFAIPSNNSVKGKDVDAQKSQAIPKNLQFLDNTKSLSVRVRNKSTQTSNTPTSQHTTPMNEEGNQVSDELLSRIQVQEILPNGVDEATYAVNKAREDNKAMRQIQEDIETINDQMSNLSGMIAVQGNSVNVVSENLEDTQARTEQGVEQIQEASDRQKSWELLCNVS